MVLGKTSSAGRSNNLDNSREWTHCACSGAGGAVLAFFLSFVISLFYLPFSGGLPNID